MFKKNYLKFFSIFLVILILIQFSYHQNLLDFYNLNFNFHDLKYSGSYLFLNNENIYEIYLEDPSSKKILYSQYPNYSVTSIYFHLLLGFFSLEKKIISLFHYLFPQLNIHLHPFYFFTHYIKKISFKFF